ncbi:DUF998 domain-containing protein [Nocardiopsis sp. EMB25]|uniref:DUF998 domain-containing protein n=1 Tax=Nocardiopsis sp. EMB25 TaxID=2835867 RepID=UPI0022842588|nr:DUF998 domain-containing protein [Nocardiopsis sp. EMB25]MCY9785978.1 DUF998 domain-containing protein [Nocardiopsis sp. EMB25]
MPDTSTASLHWDYRDGRVAAVAAAVVYSLWVLEVVLPGGGAAQGALAEPGSPFGEFLDSTHRTASILVIVAAALGLSLGTRQTRRWLLVSWWSMAAFGAISLATSLMPGACRVSTDVACAAESLVEGGQGATLAQALLSVAAVVTALVSVIALAVNRWNADDPAWPFVAVMAALQAVSAVAVLILAGILYWSSGDGDPGVALGLVQRAHLVTVALWLLTAGIVPGPWKRAHDGQETAVAR